MGRPSEFTQEIADEICAHVSDGGSIRSFCRVESNPSLQTIYNWLRVQQGFVEQYARAKDDAADAMAEDMLEIADDKDEDAQSRRVRIDTRKWIASKLKPKKYGDKLAVGGSDDLPPVAHSIEFHIVDHRAKG